jgi:hypothetical protein
VKQTCRVVASAVLWLALAGQAIGQCEVFRANGDQYDVLGDSVGVHGDWLVYTQRWVVHVMHWTGARWTHYTDLTLPSYVGQVDVYGDVIVAGVLGDSDVYVYRFDGSDWVLEQTLYDQWTNAFQHGRTLDVHGNLLVTCYPLGFPFDNGTWIYRYTGGQWVEEYSSSAPNVAVATDGYRVLLGSDSSFRVFSYDGSQWDSGYSSLGIAAGINLNLSGPLAVASAQPDLSGRAQVFRECDGQDEPWCEGTGFFNVNGDVGLAGDTLALPIDDQLKLLHDVQGQWEAFDVLSGTDADDSFGRSVEMGGEWIVVGAPKDDTNGEDSGSVYVFRRDVTYVTPDAKGSELGTCELPFGTIQGGLSALGPSGVMLIYAGTYAEAPMVLDSPVNMSAAGGTVRIE